jgi:catechol 2,3-dioxygenase-like lactoylglutathione lyase family enzyme
VEDVPNGYPDRPAVERVGARRVQEDACHSEGGGVAEQGPDILMVVEALEDGDEQGSSLWSGCSRGVGQ